jgi:hypothetical protein
VRITASGILRAEVVTKFERRTACLFSESVRKASEQETKAKESVVFSEEKNQKTLLFFYVISPLIGLLSPQTALKKRRPSLSLR